MRHKDWENRLNAYIGEARDRPFEWGQHDCILFACSAVEVMTGIDHALSYRGQYSDKRGAARMLAELGEGTLLRTIDSCFERKAVSHAVRGDLVWFEGSAGVCLGNMAAFVGEEHLVEKAGVAAREGLITIPRRCWEKAWSVG